MENISLFGKTMCEKSQDKDLFSGGPLDVVRMEFVEAETLRWEDLFSGFDSLRAITYSSAIGFVYQLVDMFEDVEVIFGSEEVLSYSLQEIMAYQCKMVDRMRDTASKMKIDLMSRVEDNTLHFFIAREKLSHEKIYLLSSSDGRKRVVMGSANMSFAAFGGKQRENICYIDGNSAYDWYLHSYNEFRDECTDQVFKETLAIADCGEHIEEIPIAQTVKVKKALMLETVEASREEVQFALDVKSLSARFAPSVPRPDKKGKTLLSPETIKIIRRQIVADQTKEKELRSEYPQLEVFVDECSVKLNGELVDLAPSSKAIAQDVSLFLRYMGGYEKFHGDVTGMQRRYFEFANWFFCSPFMGCMRDMAVRYNQNTLPYPVFGLVYGLEMSRNVQSGNTQNLKSSAAPVRLPAAPAPTPGTSRVAVPAGCVYRP